MINIYKYTPKSKKEGWVRASSKLDFFNQEDIIIKETGNQLMFIRPSISYTGKRFKVQKRSFICQFQSNIPPGTYEIDEESNEDRIIINYDK